MCFQNKCVSHCFVYLDNTDKYIYKQIWFTTVNYFEIQHITIAEALLIIACVLGFVLCRLFQIYFTAFLAAYLYEGIWRCFIICGGRSFWLIWLYYWSFLFEVCMLSAPAGMFFVCTVCSRKLWSHSLLFLKTARTTALFCVKALCTF